MTTDLVRQLLHDSHEGSLPTINEPIIFIDEEADFVEFFASRESYRSEFVDPRFTAYRSRKTNQLIGGQICGIGEVLKKAPGLRVEICGGRLKLSALFTATAYIADTDPEGTKFLAYYEEVHRVVKRIGDPEVATNC